MLIRSVLIATMLVLAGCATAPAPTPSNGPDASYNYKGDLTRDGGTTCFYYCF